MKFSKIPLSIVLLSAFLGGCSTLSSSDAGCMKTVLVSTLSTVPLHPVFKEDARIVTISTFKGGCGGSSAELPGEKGDIGINMTLTMPEAKQKHGRVKKVAFPIFVALLDKEDNVLDRQDEKIEVTISDHSLNHAHKITYHPPQGIDVDSEDHRILVGFNGPVVPIHYSALPVSGVKKSVHKKIRKGKLKRKGISQKIAKK